MVDIYADEGITGTSVEKREDFQRMMQDCRKGKIDRILVKSISRFARNTKDCLAAVRELKELGVSVQFEEQGIDTSKVSSEMVTAIMASLAQKQSESISGHVKWGVQKRMKDGTYTVSYTHLDVYKRQILKSSCWIWAYRIWMAFKSFKRYAPGPMSPSCLLYTSRCV